MEHASTPSTTQPVVTLGRRKIDSILISLGLIAAIVFTVAGFLLAWGNSFADDYVTDELTAQHITFPTEESLEEEGRSDLVKYAGQSLTTGKQAEAYASYINGHLGDVTYAELGGPERQARAAVTEAKDAGKPQAEIDELQATADGISNQRNTLFKGETLRGLLLSAYAWSTIGKIAGIASIVAFLAAAVTVLLVIAGFIHLRKTQEA